MAQHFNMNMGLARRQSENTANLQESYADEYSNIESPGTISIGEEKGFFNNGLHGDYEYIFQPHTSLSILRRPSTQSPFQLKCP